MLQKRLAAVVVAMGVTLLISSYPELASASIDVTTMAAPLALPLTSNISKSVAALPDSAVLFATGLVLFGLAGRVRRHQC